MIRSDLLTVVLLLSIPFSLSACSDAAPASSASCSEMLATCLIDQMICVDDEAEPRCEACPSSQYATSSGACEALPGVPLSHTFPENSTEAGAEILGQCRSWTLHNAEEIWVNAVELQQNEASHHSNWTFVPNTEFEGEDGIWTCADRNYSQLAAALAGGVLYAQSTQANKEVQKFPEGAAVRIPPYSRIISDIHTLNTTTETINGQMTLTIYAIEKQNVDVKLVPFHLTYDKLAIPPQSDARFYSECELESSYQNATGKPFDFDLYYVLPHTHALGTRMYVETMGGPNDGQTLIDVRGFNSEARGKMFDPPLKLTGATGLRFGCEFHNPTTEVVEWGFDDQEMCEALGFARSPLAFESRVSEIKDDGKEGSLLKFTGACGTAAFPWDHEKAGGSGPDDD